MRFQSICGPGLSHCSTVMCAPGNISLSKYYLGRQWGDQEPDVTDAIKAEKEAEFPK